VLAQFETPDEDELLELFGAEPIERSVEDGYWCYETADRRGLCLRLSFNIYERSVQTVLSLDGALIERVSHEHAIYMLVRDGKLHCEFVSVDSKALLTVELGPNLSLEWSTLRTK
jgi:hypothetical protein